MRYNYSLVHFGNSSYFFSNFDGITETFLILHRIPSLTSQIRNNYSNFLMTIFSPVFNMRNEETFWFHCLD